MKNIILMLMIVLINITYPLFAQVSNNKVIESDIQNILREETSKEYLVYAIDVNANYNVKEYVIDNKNGLLNDCNIFIANGINSDDGGFLGIYRASSIIWKTRSLTNSFALFSNDLWQVADLRRDGKVYIIISVSLPPLRQDEILWIFSWDGNTGTMVNQCDEDGGSTILSNYGGFELIDINGDGTLEILGHQIINESYNQENDEKEYEVKDVLYSWNNGLIGDFGIIKPQVLPKNRVDVKVKGKVKGLNSNFTYNYEVINEETSLQQIENFSIGLQIDTILTSKTRANWWFLNRKDLSILYFGWDPNSSDYNCINIGSAEGSFEIISAYPPAIVKYYVQGTNGSRDELESIITNSKAGYTVGPWQFQESFDSLNFLDSLINYNNHSFNLGWIQTQQMADKYDGYLIAAKTALQQNNITLARTNLQNILHDVDIDSSGAITSEAYALLRYNTEYLLSKLPQPPSGLPVKLANSTGAKLPGGSLQYYESGWKDATDNGDGTFTIDTQLKTVSLKMTYEYGSQTKSNVIVGTDTVTFQTVNTVVKLLNSTGGTIDTGKVQYYSSGWRDFGSTTNGVATKELLANNYTFRMTYGFASIDKAQNISTTTIVVFQTVNAKVELRNSSGSLVDQGTVQYYSSGWREFGTTTNGVAAKELLANNYTFRMTYGFASNDKAQNIGITPTVVFQTVNATVELRNSSGSLIDQGTVQYYSSGWREFGTTTNGVASKELLANNYTFRMMYGFASNDKAQNIGATPTVVFQTVNANVELRNSSGSLIDQGTVQYYSSGWREFGTTTNGVATKELLANNYTFRMTYGFASNDKAQNIGTTPTVVFQTVNANVELRNSSGSLIDQGTVQYYSSGWREFGTTTNGVATKELLANNYTFRMTYGFASNDKAQNIGTTPTVVFQTVNANVELRNSLGSLIDQGTVQYYSSGWREFGTTTNGVAAKELLANNYTFRMTHEYISNDKAQNIGTNSTVTFPTVLCTISVKDLQNQPVNNARASYYSSGWRLFGETINGEITKELLPANLTFRINSGSVQLDKTQNLSTSNLVEFNLGQ